MLQINKPTNVAWTAADLIARFGPIPLSRIYHKPPPGCASEQDLLAISSRQERLYELIDGTLVEKTVGTHEALLAMVLGRLLANFVEEHDLGIVMGPDAMQRVAQDQIRIPDVAFYAWERFPNRKIPAGSYLEVAADLAVEIISPSNTKKEMTTKLIEYFAAGSRLVWYVYPQQREVHVYTSAADGSVFGINGMVAGGHVLPGFELPLRKLFAKLADEEQA
jgi:Uma2 family endonuclease